MRKQMRQIMRNNIEDKTNRRTRFRRTLSTWIFLAMAAAGGQTAWGSDIVFFTSLRTPSDSLFKEIYGNSVIDSGLNYGLTIYRGLEFRLEASVFYQKGKSTVLEDETTLFLISPYAGLRYAPEVLRGVRPYLGGGGCFGFYMENSRLGEATGWAKGYKLEGGIRIKIFKRISVDFNVSHIVLRAKVDEETINLGGLRLALGVCQGF